MSKKKYSAIDYAMKYLVHAPKSERDLTAMLYRKGYTEKEVIVAKKRLKQQGLIDDKLFVKLYIDSEVIKKWKPIYVAKGHLFEKGIAKYLVEEYCSAHWDDIREGMFARIDEEINKYKKRGLDALEIIGKIEKKGYNLGYIKEVLKRRGASE